MNDGKRIVRIEVAFTVIVAAGLWATMPAHATPRSAPPDSGAVLKGDQPGTVFKTLTVEGEDRVHLEIARPTLKLDLDPASAPGLELGGAEDVLNRTRPDLMTPLFESVTASTSPFTGRPWLEELATGPVARFQPRVSDVEAWRLTVTDARGRAAAKFEGKKSPPKEIAWDGGGADDSIAMPGVSYSYVLEAKDRAGNKRTFMGDQFEVPAYRRQGANGPTMVLPGSAVLGVDLPRGATPPALLEVASWLNQLPVVTRVEITATARSHERAAALARAAHASLEPIVIGDPARLMERTVVEPEAPEAGAVVVSCAKDAGR
jgi:hypothetical protein